MKTNALDRLAGLAALAAGVVAFLYAIAFVVLRSELGSALLLLVNGWLTSIVFCGLYERFRQHTPLALLAFVFSLGGTLGAMAHGGYDLANALHPPNPSLAGLADLPSQVDPRGLFTFGLVGCGLLFNVNLMQQSQQFPRGLVWVGYLLGILLIEIYLARLILMAPTHPLLLYPVLLSGFIINPLWYLWIGFVFGRGPTNLTRVK